MRNIQWLFIVMFITATSFAQAGKYITLSQEDSQKAEQLDKSVEAAKKAQSDFRDYVKKTYIDTDKCDSTTALCPSYNEYAIGYGPNWKSVKLKYVKPGWENGFVFSEDYKLIFPDKTVVK